MLVGQPALGQRVDVGARLADVAPGLAGIQRRRAELVHARGAQRRGHLRVGPERPHLGPQDQVVAHAGGRGRPDALVVLGPRRLVVEVHRAVVAAGLERVHHPERAAHVAGAEPQVLVVPRPVLPVQVDVEQLAVPQRLGDPVRVVQPGHLLVPDLGVHPDHVAVLERVDEGQRVPHRGQQDVAARLVRLRLDREPDVVALLAHVLAEQVQALGVPVERGPDVLGGPRLGALAPAPEDVGLRAEVRRQVQVAHHLGQREPPDLAVVGGERPVPEHRVAEQVGGGGGHHQAGLGQRLAEGADALVPLGRGGVEGEHVVVVEVHPVGAEFGELVHGALGGHGRPHGAPEHVDPLPPDRPDAEREAVLPRRYVIRAHRPVLS